jgi:hypothetical protein
MTNIEVWELKFTAEAAVNHQLTSDHVKTIQLAIIKAINENADHNLLVGTTRMTIEPKEEKA